MEYLLKASAVVAIFYVSYKLFLQRETFFGQNRWFLLMGLITAFLLPFLVIPIYIEANPLDFSNYVFETAPTSKNIEKPFSILNYLPLAYGLGVLFFSVRFLMQFTSLVLVIFKNKAEKIGGFTYIKTANKLSPFSFFKWIVYNPKQFSSSELEQIITHEKVHAYQLHSFDILLAHLGCVVLWFNPFMWLYNKNLKQNLEFIADNIAATKTTCKKSYQYTLLKTSMPSHHMALSNPFYNSSIKKRIVMLHKSKSKKINQLKYVLVIPVLGLFLMSFNTKKMYIEKTMVHSEKQNQDKPPLYVVDGKETSKEDAENIQPERIETVNVLKGKAATEKYGNKGKQGVIEITTKGKNAGANDQKSLSKVEVNGYEESQDKKPLLLFNEKEITKEAMSSIDPNAIEKVEVIKNENATKLYGNKGKDGVIIITSKNDPSKYTVKLSDEALYKINGKEAKKVEVDKLNPNDIESVNVYKGNTAIEKYGNKAKNGVVEITTKKK